MTTVEPQTIDEAARRLAEATRTRKPCAPVRDLIGKDDVATAYRVQSQNVAALVSAGRRVVGRKIGLTSPAVQNQLGVTTPDFGVLLDDMDCTGDDAVDITRLLQPKIEAEIAFRMSTDVVRPTTAAESMQTVDRIYAAFEIVDSRVAGWDISLGDTVADNASSGLYVLGDSILPEDAPDLREVIMTATADGEQVSSGRGADCLGSPWEALAWLANMCIEYGSPLRAGDIVLSGALGPMVSVAPGATYVTEITGIGSATAVFTDKDGESGR